MVFWLYLPKRKVGFERFITYDIIIIFPTGLVSIGEDLNGIDRIIEPFPPGTFEEYEIMEDGRTKLLKRGIFHSAGLKPQFKPFMPYEGKKLRYYDEELSGRFSKPPHSKII